MQRVPRPSIPARKEPRRAGKCDVPGIFVADPAEVWNLPDGIVTEVRPRTPRASRAGRPPRPASSL